MKQNKAHREQISGRQRGGGRGREKGCAGARAPVQDWGATLHLILTQGE